MTENIRRTREEEGKGGSIIDCNKLLAAKKVLTNDKTGLASIDLFLDVLFPKTLTFPEILSLNSFQQNFRSRFQKVLANMIERRISALQFDSKLLKLLDLESLLNV